jgi:hypothetical protein
MAMPTSPPLAVKRHPIRGLFSGLFLGLGLALMVMAYGKAPFNTATPYVCIVAGLLAGLLMGLGGPRRGRR